MQISKQTLVAGAVVLLIVGATAGFLASGSGFGRNMLFQVPASNSATAELLGLTGTVKEISGNTIVLDTSSMPKMAGAPAIRRVEIAANTTLIKQTAKDPKQFQAELAAYQKKSSSLPPGEALSPPSPMEQTNISLTDIKTGDSLSVAADHDIRTAADFQASQIIVLPPTNIAPPPPPPPPATP